jgi:hypothetical protein
MRTLTCSRIHCGSRTWWPLRDPLPEGWSRRDELVFCSDRCASYKPGSRRGDPVQRRVRKLEPVDEEWEYIEYCQALEWHRTFARLSQSETWSWSKHEEILQFLRDYPPPDEQAISEAETYNRLADDELYQIEEEKRHEEELNRIELEEWDNRHNPEYWYARMRASDPRLEDIYGWDSD